MNFPESSTMGITTRLLSHTALACTFAALSLGATAKESPVGSITHVDGNVSVGGLGFVSKAARGATLVDGNVVMVSSGAKATVKLNDGCTIWLKAGQHLTLNSKMTCYEHQASVAQMFSPYSVAQVGGTVSGGGAAGGAGGLGVVAVMAGVSVIAFAAVENDEKTSP